jgi:hypothetical protein
MCYNVEDGLLLQKWKSKTVNEITKWKKWAKDVWFGFCLLLLQIRHRQIVIQLVIAA